MKVIMYMAISVNGMIAKEDDDTSWITANEWKHYSHAVRKSGGLIVGRRTYNILTKQTEFSEFKDVKIVVVSKNKDIEMDLVDDKHKIASSPEEALKIFEGFKEVIVAGGGILNNSFLKEGLVDEIYLDIEPKIIGEGIPLFRGDNLDIGLELISEDKISDSEIVAL